MRRETGSLIRFLIMICLLIRTFSFSQENPIALCQNMYDNREFTAALSCVRGQLDSGRVTTRIDSFKAFELAGMLCYILDDYDNANVYFRDILGMDRFAEPDPVTVPPEILAFYKRQKSAFEQEHPLITLAPPVPKKSALRLLPFGAGHIREKKYFRGFSYAAAAAVCLGINIVSYNSRKLLESPNGRYAPDDLDSAVGLYNIQVGSFYGGFLGIGFISFVDALITN
ncbi:MAG: hypothetical protein A2268_01990 [Candidatus Raymondbacteria bacterium RifOxyA12_full_50_37]|uniref:Uncharacterized protein n=1 Tax=Candidatus Raymondbacteria bacterium RIFOXYD12_FULL_49_13 TaxID=1817890 RepID=A0A1F7F5T2_UNCRA|nr:MAG: hypothetical protein A2268_01990 [Candidatus Raymondbacteria bacterium RifOxyA12_full_50_37]OGJ92114.1 MAG: hypothetical protein A2248_10820 [Candidatus Raymondbacteria bacterium RIFOXYA2_FULL_49_16]OGJ93480.1 MAG: hypothetical protein A2487_20675 [Candidatus Raymondbacteria bacterium RifOxyC12_full_50_8]OGJ98470.1 MAG: hypothetical protein A2453_07060 [Candidatus Raymondbacteria bacterium RIFOXYC2_FULL_50_21]OGK00246.1 MAG: hypothetical protein A2350_05120 [Candidatus Raymondbacteria b